MTARVFTWLMLSLSLAAAAAGAEVAAAGAHAAPRAWDEKALADWATPVVGLGVRPGHFSVAEYYASPVENTRTYPVYHPDREPEGYWQWLQSLPPAPLVEEVGKERTLEEWVELGQRVFLELDVAGFRRAEPEIIAKVRSREAIAKAGVKVMDDGTLFGMRWVPTAQGLTLGVNDCAHCHTRFLDDGRVVRGAPMNVPFDEISGRHLIAEGMGYFFPGEPLAVQLHRLYAAPWIPGDVNEQIRTMTMEQLGVLRRSNPPGTFARANGSPFYPTKVPDLIGIRDRQYIDHTATHLLRGPEDVMRYGAMVAYEDKMEFGSHQFYSDEQRVVRYHYPDDTLYALARYIFSLEPPANPNPFDRQAAAGQKIFHREGCAGCHTPPVYSNNKLTLAQGFTPPEEHYEMLRIMKVSVGTDPGLAMKTRKGTGYYKVPSLRGLWYRGLYLHDGAVTSLEEMFNPDRLRDDFVPSGFKGYQVEHRAVPGHKFGLSLDEEERAQLIAFLRTL